MNSDASLLAPPLSHYYHDERDYPPRHASQTRSEAVLGDSYFDVSDDEAMGEPPTGFVDVPITKTRLPVADSHRTSNTRFLEMSPGSIVASTGDKPIRATRPKGMVKQSTHQLLEGIAPRPAQNTSENVEKQDRQWVESVCENGGPEGELGAEAREDAHETANQEHDQNFSRGVPGYVLDENKRQEGD
ncbi:hypothetical protein NL676_008284 [Syzygium grande]|nr:hypothetical protein NL676_008284 [Syzygium grande]